MSLQSRLSAFIAAVGADIKVLQTAAPNATFLATKSASQTAVTAGSWQPVAYGTEVKDTNNVYNPTTGRFTAPNDGSYEFNCGFLVSSAVTNAYMGLEVFFAAGGSTIYQVDLTTMVQLSATRELSLLAGDQVRVVAWVDAVRDITAGSGTYFSGHAVQGRGVKGDTGSVSNLPKTVRGIVNSDGTIAKGSGFTVARIGPGEYTITFTQAFTDTPACFAMARTGVSGDKAVQMDTTEPSTGSFRISVRDPSASGNVVDVGFHFIAMATDGQTVPAPPSTFNPVFLADTDAAPDDTEKISWRAANGALVAEVRAWTDAAGELAQTEVRALSSSTKKAEAQLYAGNGSTRARVRSTNNPALSTKKREVVAELHDDSGTVILTRKVLVSDGTSDFLLIGDSYWLDPSWENLTLTAGWTSIGGVYGPVSARRDGSGRVHLRGLVKNSTAGAGQTIPLVLPAKFIPFDTSPLLVIVYTGTGAEQTGQLYVHGASSATPGRLAITPGIGNNGYISLAGIVLPVI